MISRLRSERAAVKLAFATMMRAATRWTRVSVILMALILTLAVRASTPCVGRG